MISMDLFKAEVQEIKDRLNAERVVIGMADEVFPNTDEYSYEGMFIVVFKDDKVETLVLEDDDFNKELSEIGAEVVDKLYSRLNGDDS
jgi:hypothetical protein